MSGTNTFTCHVPENGQTFLECTIPSVDPGFWEILTAIGTTGATIAAVVFGGWSILEAKKARDQAHRLTHVKNRAEAGQLLTNEYQRIASIYPEITIDDVIHLQEKTLIYRSFLRKDDVSEQELGELLHSILMSFGSVCVVTWHARPMAGEDFPRAEIGLRCANDEVKSAAKTVERCLYVWHKNIDAELSPLLEELSALASKLDIFSKTDWIEQGYFPKSQVAPAK